MDYLIGALIGGLVVWRWAARYYYNIGYKKGRPNVFKAAPYPDQQKKP